MYSWSNLTPYCTVPYRTILVYCTVQLYCWIGSPSGCWRESSFTARAHECCEDAASVVQADVGRCSSRWSSWAHVSVFLLQTALLLHSYLFIRISTHCSVHACVHFHRSLAFSFLFSQFHFSHFVLLAIFSISICCTYYNICILYCLNVLCNVQYIYFLMELMSTSPSIVQLYCTHIWLSNYKVY